MNFVSLRQQNTTDQTDEQKHVVGSSGTSTTIRSQQKGLSGGLLVCAAMSRLQCATQIATVALEAAKAFHPVPIDEVHVDVGQMHDQLGEWTFPVTHCAACLHFHIAQDVEIDI